MNLYYNILYIVHRIIILYVCFNVYEKFHKPLTSCYRRDAIIGSVENEIIVEYDNNEFLGHSE